MTSSTDVLSNDSLCQGDDVPVSPQKRRSSCHSNSNIPSEEVQEEIEAMIQSIPQVNDVFTIINKIGSGTFSSVYVAKLKNHPEITEMFALKHIIPTSHPSRIESELRCLYDIGGVDNVMGVKACFRERDHVVIVMPYFDHAKFQDYVQLVSVKEVQEYMRALLVALRRVHSVNIIHRDVKPSNFLCNRPLKKYALVDFGLAQMAPASVNKSKDASGEPSQKLSSSDGKKSRTHSDSQVPSSSSQKRKFRSDDTENNLPDSPQKKRRQHSESALHSRSVSASAGLAVIDTNKPESTMAKLARKSEPPPLKHAELIQNNNEKSAVHMTPPVPGLLKPSQMKTVKSPRRLLLTKQTLDKQRCTLFDQPGGSGKTGGGTGRGSVVVMEKGGKKMYKMVAPTSCQCYGRPVICSICMARSGQQAPRAGTPGFRAPEVLLKCPDQTTAIDIWSAGVIFLSLLSGRYPFFKAPDDLTALAQIISVIGSEEVKAGALSIGKNLLCNPKISPVNVPVMCKELRNVTLQRQLEGKNSKKPAIHDLINDWSRIPDTAYDLLKKLLDINPNTRATADEALQHPFFSEDLKSC